MARIILKTGHEIEFEEFDIIKFNADMISYGIDAEYFEVEYYGHKIGVDLFEKKIFVDDALIHEDPRLLENIRFINFRRCQEERTMDGRPIQKKVIAYGFGFQATLDGENVKKVFMINPNGDLC